jgi:hypothetical protein
MKTNVSFLVLSVIASFCLLLTGCQIENLHETYVPDVIEVSSEDTFEFKCKENQEILFILEEDRIHAKSLKIENELCAEGRQCFAQGHFIIDYEVSKNKDKDTIQLKDGSLNYSDKRFSNPYGDSALFNLEGRDYILYLYRARYYSPPEAIVLELQIKRKQN